jgi:hypothetical protein
MKRRILFVNGELLMLEGLRHRLHPRANNGT